MPVAPATFMSLAICVSFWMLMSFRSVMFSPSPGRRGAPAFAGSGAASGDAGPSAAGTSGAEGGGVWRFWLVAIDKLYRVRVLADGHDAAGNDRMNGQRPRAGDQAVTFGARV